MSDIPRLIEESNAIQFGKFKLSNGSLTDYYIDKYVFETKPAILASIVEEISSMLSSEEIDVVVGPELGAVPLVTGVSLETGIDAAFIRKGEKHYGTRARIEGTIEEGQRVAIIEDVTTTGNTVLDTATVVEAVGGVVDRTITVVDRDENAIENVAASGYELEALVQIGSDITL